MKSKLLIIGAGGHGKVVAEIAMKMNRWSEIAFLDNNESKRSSLKFEVIGKSDDAFRYICGYDLFVAIGDNRIREELQEKLEKAGASIPVLVHPQSIIGNDVSIGMGTVLMAGVIINCCSKVGKGCIVNTGATIDHDNVIEDFVHLSPGTHIAGNVRIGKGTWIGIGGLVSNNVSIITRSIIGAGAVVVKDINTAGTYVGVPARGV
ncbi:acetyltransferase [Paenibacillus xylanilyticus]|uniref:Acetyltransferase n=1 Tax=Paenibacillus xylanilyticus TaxID=248903 RepID=A0A7Y6BVF3_9BACL|nr:acetyltransferase [Paenibacillus xylanilyticus]NUU75303.1 acetyltransferase [Paenibacillus xylanilyticus]